MFPRLTYIGNKKIHSIYSQIYMSQEICYAQDEIVQCILQHAHALQTDARAISPPTTWYPILLDTLTLRRCVTNRLGSHAAFLFRSILLNCYASTSQPHMRRVEFSADCISANLIEEGIRALLAQKEHDSLYLHHERDLCTQTRERWILARRLTVSDETSRDLMHLSLALCFWYYMLSRIRTQSPYALALLYLRTRRRILEPDFLARFAHDCSFGVRGYHQGGRPE